MSPIDGVINVNLNVIPGNDFGLEGNQVLLLEARDPKTKITKPITIRPKKSNTPSDFKGICWVNDRTFLPHPFSTEPQNVCTVIGTSQEQFFCRTNSSVPLSIPENELSKFIALPKFYAKNYIEPNKLLFLKSILNRQDFLI